MPVYVSTRCLVNGNSVCDVLETYARAGLTNVELGCSHECIGDVSPAEFKKYGLNLIAHHYFLPPPEPLIVNLASQDQALLKRSQEQIRRSIDFCHSTGITLFTFHAGFRADPDEKFMFPKAESVSLYEIAFSTFIASVDDINKYAQDKGVRIAIENNVASDYNVLNGQNPFLLLCEAEEYEKLWERTPSANVGILLDLGHLKVTSHWLNFDKYEFIDKVKDRVFAIHVHENNSIVDEHRKLDETSWCLQVTNRECFADLPVVIECVGLNIEEIVQQVDLMQRIPRG